MGCTVRAHQWQDLQKGRIRTPTFIERRSLQGPVPPFRTVRKTHIIPPELHEAKDHVGLITLESHTLAKYRAQQGLRQCLLSE